MDFRQTIVTLIAALVCCTPSIVAEEAAQPLLTALGSTTITGYADVAAHWNPGSGHPTPPPLINGTQILWQHEDGRVATWHMAGTELIFSSRISFPTLPFSESWAAAAFDNGSILLRQGNLFWNNGSYIYATPLFPLKNMSFGGAAQLVGNAENDLVWGSPSQLLVWEMNGNRVARQHVVSSRFYLPPDARLVSIDHFDKNKSSDLLWQDRRGTAWVTLMDGLTPRESFPLHVPRPGTAKWKLCATADLNSDGHIDLLWHHEDGRVAAWLMNDTARTASVLLRGGKPVGPGWRMVDARATVMVHVAAPHFYYPNPPIVLNPQLPEVPPVRTNVYVPSPVIVLPPENPPPPSPSTVPSPIIIVPPQNPLPPVTPPSPPSAP